MLRLLPHRHPGEKRCGLYPAALFPLLITSIFLAVPCAGQALPDGVILFARIRQHVAPQITRLQNYSCYQTSTRYRMQGAKAGKKHRINSAEPLTLEIAHIGGKDLFAWPGEGSFESRSAAGIVGGGLTDTGGFSAFARSIFVDNVATVKFKGNEDLRGRESVRYDYRVGSFLAGYTVRTLSGSAKLGYSGSFWADPQTHDLLELVVQADAIPEFLDVAEVLTVINYGNTKLGGSSSLLRPQSVRTSMRYTSGDVSENLTDFTNCRQFTAESTISFDAPPEDAGKQARKIETVTLPPGLMVATKLVTAVDSTTARVGDPITARVEVAASAKHRVWLPEGTILNGRVRRVEKFANPAESVLIGLEFTDFSFENHRGVLFADFQRTDAKTSIEGALPVGATSVYTMQLLHMGSEQSTSIEAFTNHELPGVATFYFPGKTGRIQPGTEIIWKTRKFTAP